MKINTVNEFRVEVELSAAEQEALGVRFESLDWADVETRRALWSVLGALREQGVEIGLSGRLLIEAAGLPSGLRLCFTVLPQKSGGSAPRIVKGEPCRVLRFETEGDMRRAAGLLPGPALSAYRRGGRYYLLLAGACAPAALARAAEFGVNAPKSAPLARELLEEYCEAVALHTE